jgi:ankyrin repeat protein
MVMKLKQLLLISIATLSLGGSLYGMNQYGIYGKLIHFGGMEQITCENPTEFFNLILHGTSGLDIQKIQLIAQRHPAIVNMVDPNSHDNETALDYAIELMNPNLVEALLRLGSNVNTPGKDYLETLLVHRDDEKKIQILHLLCTAGINLDDFLYHVEQELNEDETALHNILQNHINTRLATAILNNNANEVQRIITKYNININQELPCYGLNYGTRIEKDPYLSSFIPLHEAALCGRSDDVARLLVNELNADVTIQDARYGKNALHHEPNVEIAQLLIAKGCDINAADNNGNKPIDQTAWVFTPDGLHELRGSPERVANFRALKTIFEGQPNIPANNAPNNNGGPQPDPIDPTIINGNAFSWKWIGGGAVVVGAAVVAAKKLYDWYYKKSEIDAEDEQNEQAEQNEQNQDAAKDKTATQK